MDNTNREASKYLIHYQLEDIFRGCTKIGLYTNGIVLFFILIVGEYPSILSSMDATFTLMTIIFFTFVFPAMRKGKIIAYYRYSYHEMIKTNLALMITIMGAVIRTPITYGLHCLSYVIFNDSSKIDYDISLLRLMFNPICNLIAIGLFLFYIYLLFYKDKFSTMEEYSIEVTRIFKLSKSHMSYEKCVDQFVMEKFKKKTNSSIALEKERQLNQPCIRVERIVKNEDIGIKNINIEEVKQTNQFSEKVIKNEPEIIVRRQARIMGGNVNEK